jgi:hypothetical protein
LFLVDFVVMSNSAAAARLSNSTLSFCSRYTAHVSALLFFFF